MTARPDPVWINESGPAPNARGRAGFSLWGLEIRLVRLRGWSTTGYSAPDSSARRVAVMMDEPITRVPS